MDKAELLHILSRDTQAKRFSDGEIIVSDGQPATEGVGFIISGAARVFQMQGESRVVLGHIMAGQFFGETALVLARPRSASIEAAADDTVVMFLSPANFRANIATNFSFLDMLMDHTVTRVEYVIAALSRLNFEQPLIVDPSLVAVIAENRRQNLMLQDMLNHTRSAWIGPDNPAFAQGDRNDQQSYLVVKGQISIFRSFEKRRFKLFTLSEGDIFGFTPRESPPFRKYDARAVGDSARIISFDSDLMEKLMRLNQERFYYVFRSIVTQLVVLDDALRLASGRKVVGGSVPATLSTGLGSIDYLAVRQTDQ